MKSPLIVIVVTSNEGFDQVETKLWRQPAMGCLVPWAAISILERLLAAITFVLVSPVLTMAALVTMILSRQTPFIAHRRVGLHGHDLWIVKLRTMWDGQPPFNPKWRFVERLPTNGAANPVTKMSGDPRVRSGFAVMCRRYSIDELPQLWQIACGQLALVGPRPITRFEVETYYDTVTELLVSRKPGLTGLWQVSGRSRLSYHQRKRLDLFMLRKWSLPLYLLILARTIRQAPIGKDAW